MSTVVVVLVVWTREKCITCNLFASVNLFRVVARACAEHASGGCMSCCTADVYCSCNRCKRSPCRALQGAYVIQQVHLLVQAEPVRPERTRRHLALLRRDRCHHVSIPSLGTGGEPMISLGTSAESLNALLESCAHDRAPGQFSAPAMITTPLTRTSMPTPIQRTDRICTLCHRHDASTTILCCESNDHPEGMSSRTLVAVTQPWHMCSQRNDECCVEHGCPAFATTRWIAQQRV